MRSLFWRVLRMLLFRLDAESAHWVTTRLIHAVSALGSAPLRLASGAANPARIAEGVQPQVFGLGFLSRVGLAAGFDKNAEILTALPALGFGFAEIGTVTPRPQPGNPRPRLFRDRKRAALFNRMGFNGLGASIVSQRLAASRARLPSGFRVGVNLGKNKDTALEDAASDYVLAAVPFEGLADYLVINVSSPNTPGLRALQSATALRKIVSETRSAIEKWDARPPLLLKLAPEIHGASLRELIEAVEGWGAIDGWVLTNTLAGNRPGDPVGGGWSGSPLKESSRRSLRDAREVSRLPIISVGGIDSPVEARARIESGAQLVQIYSGWVFGGPTLPARVSREISGFSA